MGKILPPQKTLVQFAPLWAGKRPLAGVRMRGVFPPRAPQAAPTVWALWPLPAPGLTGGGKASARRPVYCPFGGGPPWQPGARNQALGSFPPFRSVRGGALPRAAGPFNRQKQRFGHSRRGKPLERAPAGRGIKNPAEAGFCLQILNRRCRGHRRGLLAPGNVVVNAVSFQGYFPLVVQGA